MEITHYQSQIIDLLRDSAVFQQVAMALNSSKNDIVYSALHVLQFMLAHSTSGSTMLLQLSDIMARHNSDATQQITMLQETVEAKTRAARGIEQTDGCQNHLR